MEQERMRACKNTNMRNPIIKDVWGVTLTATFCFLDLSVYAMTYKLDLSSYGVLLLIY